MSAALVSLEQCSSVMPLQYETAIKALDACTTVDETKHWDDMAAALAAWAKIFKSHEAELKAKRLKLYTYRRMGQLAIAIRPFPLMNGGGHPGARGRLPGPVSLLREHGLTPAQAGAARFIGQLPQEEFERLLEKPFAPTTIVQRSLCKDPLWLSFCRTGMALRVFLRRHPAREIYARAQMLGERQERTSRVLIMDLVRMLRDFDTRIKDPPADVPSERAHDEAVRSRS